MNFDKETLIQKLQQPLPGYLSHKKMSTASRNEELLRLKIDLSQAKKKRCTDSAVSRTE